MNAAKIKIFFLLLVTITFAADLEVTPFLRLEMESTCPDNILYVTAILSNGAPAQNVELRLILHSPYQGLRAIYHTEDNGSARFELTKSGQYRIYIENSDYYNNDDFVPFVYSLCPPPPPEDYNLSITPNCNSNIVEVKVTKEGQPIEDMLIITQEWSSMTGDSGIAAFPLFEGEWFFVSANKTGYSYQETWVNMDCNPL